MGAHENNNLIGATQNRLQPRDRIPGPPEDLHRSSDDQGPIEISSGWERPGVPDWLNNPVPGEQISIDDIPTIEEEGIPSQDLADEQENTSVGEAFPTFDVWAFYLPFHFYRNTWGV
jgi:hypothetical protein